MSYGLNLLSQFVRDRQALLNLLLQLKPAAIVEMDDIGLGRHIKSILPNTLVIHRQYHPHDHEWHTKIVAAEWVAQHAHYGQGGIVVQCLNEPQGYGDVVPLVRWCIDVMRAAKAAGIRLALPAFAMGHPDENHIRSGTFDPLIRELAASNHVLFLHEYMVDDPTLEPYHIGRCYEWVKRARAIGVNPPQGVIGEHGRDRGGGALDGWRGVGWSEAKYFQRLEAAQTVYRNLFGSPISVCIFGYGAGADGRWQSFDVEGANTLLSNMVEANRRMAAQPNYGTRTEGVAALVNASRLRIRPQPNTSQPEVGFLEGGEVVTYFSTPADGWFKIVWQGVERYVSAQYIRFEDVVDTNPPVYLPQLEFDLNGQVSKAELATWLRGVADVIEHGVVETQAA